METEHQADKNAELGYDSGSTVAPPNKYSTLRSRFNLGPDTMRNHVIAFLGSWLAHSCFYGVPMLLQILQIMMSC